MNGLDFGGIAARVFAALRRIAATRSLGILGFVPAAGLFGSLIWMGIDFEVIYLESPRAITHVSMFALASILTAGMIWSPVRRGLSGQVDADGLETDRMQRWPRPGTLGRFRSWTGLTGLIVDPDKGAA